MRNFFIALRVISAINIVLCTYYAYKIIDSFKQKKNHYLSSVENDPENKIDALESHPILKVFQGDTDNTIIGEESNDYYMHY